MRVTPLLVAGLVICAISANVGAATTAKGNAKPGSVASAPAAKLRPFMAWKKKKTAAPAVAPAKAARPAMARVAPAAASVPGATSARRVRLEWEVAPALPAPSPAPVDAVAATADPVPPPASVVASAGGVLLPPGPTLAAAGGVAGGVAGEPAGSSAPAPPPPQASTRKPAPPKTVQLAVQYRGRAEGGDGYAAVRGSDDGYYLNRVRLDVAVNATPWMRGFVQIQDAEAIGYDAAPKPPATHVNRFDVRQGYVELGRPGRAGVLARVGRQEFTFGEQRLMGGGDWNNTARAFDAARMSFVWPGARVDAFVASVVAAAPYDVDLRRTDEYIYGAYVALDRIVPRGVVEPYVIVKRADTFASETGVAGRGRFHTVGARAAGKIPGGFDYSVEHAWQGGTLATDALNAMAGAYRLGWAPARWPMAPRVVGEFNHATGDALAGDGRRQTFDQLYPTNHGKYGITDVMGWRNMRDAMLGVELAPAKRVKVSADLHRLRLATTQDGLYVDGGARRLLNRAATSRDVGVEFDLQSTFTLTPKIGVSAGFGYLAAGDYLVQTTGGGNVWFPYAMWTVRF